MAILVDRFLEQMKQEDKESNMQKIKKKWIMSLEDTFNLPKSDYTPSTTELRNTSSCDLPEKLYIRGHLKIPLNTPIKEISKEEIIKNIEKIIEKRKKEENN